MEITLEIFQIFDLMAFTTAFILGLVFLFKPPKTNIYLGLFLISLGLEVFQVFITEVSIYNDFEIVEVLNFPTLVFLLFYVQKNILGYIPKKAWFVLGLGLVISFFIPLIINNNEEFLAARFLDYTYNISIIAYLFKILTIHQKNVINYYSEIEQKTLSWIQTILYIMLGFYIFWIAEDIISLFNQELPEIFALISTIATCILIYWIGYKGLSQPEIFNQSLYKEDKIEPNNTLGIENKTNTINNEDLSLFNELKEQIINQKLYTNQQLNLRGLAIELNIKEKELSRIINTQTNFYQLINTLRVNEFKTLIQSPKANQLSLLGLAQEAGFSSKSTFYTAFKKLEGMTPKQYENSIN
ncbi:helix-turn-helix domain-containing protein [Pseudofulvibacter geojedonensis]|uniref:Helix-turn-helix domain-containing protein n=1 Tax=Pseudofulvibacter geojedonensis TaxID=1123758 RepID=A0ABW3I4C1_9FLAO